MSEFTERNEEASWKSERQTTDNREPTMTPSPEETNPLQGTNDTRPPVTDSYATGTHPPYLACSTYSLSARATSTSKVSLSHLSNSRRMAKS